MRNRGDRSRRPDPAQEALPFGVDNPPYAPEAAPCPDSRILTPQGSTAQQDAAVSQLSPASLKGRIPPASPGSAPPHAADPDPARLTLKAWQGLLVLLREFHEAAAGEHCSEGP